MHFYKNIEHKDRAVLEPSKKFENYEGRQSFLKYFSIFNFQEKIYKDKKLFFKNIHNKDITLVPDLAAAICSQLFKSGLFSIKAINNGMEYIRDIIQNQNYEFISDETLLAKLVKHSTGKVNNLIYVAGCQNESMLKQRVKKAAQFAYSMTKVFDEKIPIVFSGRNPTIDNTSSFTIPNESSLMDILFTQFLEEIMAADGKEFDPDLKFSRMETIMENNSNTTRENIRRMFIGDISQGVQRHFLSTERGNNIILVSSSFHLIRLVKELELYRYKNEIQYSLENIVLVGSEKLIPEINIEDDGYIKLMFFEIFDHILTHNRPQ
jgi:hypothetical protein